MIFCSDCRQGIALVTMLLEVVLRDLAKYAGKTVGHTGFFFQVGSFEQGPIDLRRRYVGHFFNTYDQHHFAATCPYEINPLVDRG